MQCYLQQWRGPLSALPRDGGDIRGDFRCLLFSCGFAALGLRKFSQRSLSAMRHSTKLFLTTKFAKDTKGPDIFWCCSRASASNKCLSFGCGFAALGQCEVPQTRSTRRRVDWALVSN